MLNWSDIPTTDIPVFVKRKKPRGADNTVPFWRFRGPFLERSGNCSRPKANFKIKTCWLVAQFLAHNPFNWNFDRECTNGKHKTAFPFSFALLTDSFIVSSLNYWKFDRECKNGKHKTAFPFSFALLTDSFIVSSLNYWKFDRECKKRQTQNSFPGPKRYRDFKKRTTGPKELADLE